MLHVQLAGLMIADALAIVERRLDDQFAREAKQLAIDLVNDGVNRDSIDAMLDHERAKFAVQRKEHRAEFIGWLIRCDDLDELLMPSTAKH